MKEKVLTIVGLSILAIVVGMVVYEKMQYKRIIRSLTSMNPQNINSFRIYRRFNQPIGVPEKFRTPDPIIDAFFQSLGDIRSYSPSHDTVASQDHSWFLEVATEGKMIQIHCYVPSDRGDLVVGELGEFREGGGGPHYGWFQSRKLYQWYQTYKHRWLSPPAVQE
jgi:hypothetical protein